MHTNTKVALKPNFMSSLLLSLNMLILRALSKFQIFIRKIPKDLPYIFLVLNAVFTVYHVKAVYKTTSPQKLFPSDCTTLYERG